MSKRKASSDASQGAAKRPTIDDEESSSDSDSQMDQSQRPDFQTELKEAEVGIIEKVSLRNFMCHNKLDIPFGPNINFILGRNGSGKSAVLTAVVVGLGGKASATSRGNKIKSFIKTGKQSGDVEIKLRNRGVDAFKHDEYGDSIIVQRKFSNDGGSSYKLKAKNGTLISSKKEDLSRILDHFNIQVDNPVAVLNQETSKNFLNSRSAHDKYKFFLKATQLDQIKEDYSRASQHKHITDEIIEQKIQTLPKLEKEVFDWEQKYKSLTAIDELKNKVKQLKNELAWAWVIEKEKGITPLQKELQVEESRLPRFAQKADESKAKFETKTARLKELQSLLNDSGKEVKELQPAHQEAKVAVNDQKRVARAAQNGVKQVDALLHNSKKEKDSIVCRIKEMQTAAQHDYAAERQARLEKIEDLEERVRSLEAQEQTTDHQLEQFRSAVTKYKNDTYKISQDVQANQFAKDKKERFLHTLRNSQGNRLKRFGAYMPQLIQAIESTAQLGKFHQKPIGPLGACFTLRDQKWALAIESCLKGLMNAFCCHDYHDEKLLEQLVSERCPPRFKATIIVSRFKDRTYDVSALRAQSDRYPAIIDMIQTDSPMVANSLIDQRGVECILLIESGREAREVMDPDRHPPRYATEAFTLNGDQVLSFPTFRYYSSNQDQAKFLTANEQENIAAMMKEVQELKQRIAQLGQQKIHLDAEIQQNVSEERRAERQVMKIRETKQRYKMEINEMKNIEDPAPVDVTTLEEEEKLLDDKLLELESQKESKVAAWQAEDQKLKELDVKFKDIEAQMKIKIDAADNIKEEVGTVVNEVEASKGHQKHYDTKLKEQENKIKELKNKLEKYEKEVENDTSKAKVIHEERINTRRKPSNLESEIEQIYKQIKNQEKIQGNRDEIALKYQEKKQAYMRITKEVGQMRTFCQRLAASLQKRNEAYGKIAKSIRMRVKWTFICQLTKLAGYEGKLDISPRQERLDIFRLDQVVDQRLQQYTKFRRMIAMRAKYFFVVLLSNRQYTGKMTFNHQKESLEMSVQPANAGEGARDLKSLSGGERSFSTVCFILSLWDAIESPFRCLDEFDVFMDMVNRRISMDMMMIKAKQQRDRQFIFLSPQDMSQFSISSPNMKIYKMPDPDRNQSTLPFRPEGQEEEE